VFEKDVVVVRLHFLHNFRFQFLTEHNSDEEWKLDVICDALSQRRPGEKCIVLPDYFDNVNLILQCESNSNIYCTFFQGNTIPDTDFSKLQSICNQRQ